MIYLGTLGRMIGIKCPASQSVETEERYTFKPTLEGRRKAQHRPFGKRTWSLQTSDATSPREHSALSQFAQGAWGPGPFVFVPADAPHTNMFTPDASMCLSSENPSTVIYQGGPMRQPDGSWAGSSYMSPQPSLRMFFGRKEPSLSEPGERVPLPPEGGKVTGGATIMGAGSYVEIVFYDFSDSVISSAPSPVSASAWEPAVAHVVAEIPAGAVCCRVIARSAVQGSAPFLVWGERPPAWVEGQGCSKAVVHQASRSLVLAVPGSTFSNVGFTVSEVG